MAIVMLLRCELLTKRRCVWVVRAALQCGYLSLSWVLQFFLSVAMDLSNAVKLRGGAVGAAGAGGGSHVEWCGFRRPHK